MQNNFFKKDNYISYLNSKTWNDKRIEALKHYGCICSKCGEYGTDVHHKTYKRFGGNETIFDLQVMCRACHSVLHEVYKPEKNIVKKIKTIHIRAILAKLSTEQKGILIKKYNRSLSCIVYDKTKVGDSFRKDCLTMLKYDKIIYN